MTPLPHPLCENIHSKKLYMLGTREGLTVEDLETAGYENYWCQHTMTDTGPDGGWVRYDRCNAERQCYRAPGAPVGEVGQLDG